MKDIENLINLIKTDFISTEIWASAHDMEELDKRLNITLGKFKTACYTEGFTAGHYQGLKDSNRYCGED